MPTFTETKQPYELLVRWDHAGAIAGAHVGFRTITTKDGVVIADKPDDVMPVAVGGAAGYPLADILGQLQIDALARIDALTADVAAANALAARATELQAQIDALTPASTEDATVDDLQIRLALSGVGLRTDVETAVAAGDQTLKDWYERAKKFKRHDPMVLALAAALNVTDEQLDALWALAASL